LIFTFQCIYLCLGETSICSEAPSLSDLSRELAQYEDLLNDSILTNDADGSQEDLGGLHIELICQTKLENSGRTNGAGDDKLDMDLVHRLGSIFMPPSNAEANDFCKRPTAASLGLRETIEECLHDKEDLTGNS